MAETSSKCYYSSHYCCVFQGSPNSTKAMQWKGTLYLIVQHHSAPKIYHQAPLYIFNRLYYGIYMHIKYKHTLIENWWKRYHEFVWEWREEYGRTWRNEREERIVVMKIQLKKKDQMVNTLLSYWVWCFFANVGQGNDFKPNI